MNAPDMLLIARGLVSRGFSVFPLDHPDDTWVTDPDQIGRTPAIKWKPYQETRPTDADLVEWFGNGRKRNVGLVTGAISNVVIIDGDSAEGLAWMRKHLPPTPMRTKTAKGEHWGYQHPGVFIKNKVRIRTGDPAIKVDVRGDGGFAVGPGSLHNKGVVYTPVGTWPQERTLPTFDPAWLESEVAEEAPPSPKLPPSIPHGQRHHTLWREGCRLRRLGWEKEEIGDALWSLHKNRSEGPDGIPASDEPRKNIDTIAAGVPRENIDRIAKDICERYTPAVDTFPLTEAGDAELFALIYAEHVRHDHRRDRWLILDDRSGIWLPDRTGHITTLALDQCACGRPSRRRSPIPTSGRRPSRGRRRARAVRV